MADQNVQQVPSKQQGDKGPHESDMKAATDRMADKLKTVKQDVNGSKQV
jgi:hypothetical protein